MQTETILKLNQLNQNFYQTQAQSFSQTRQGYWTGWQKLLPFIETLTNTPLKVLDVGCGNGRFGQFLADNVNRQIKYTGTDSSRELLKIAQTQNPKFNFAKIDLINSLLTQKPITPNGHKYDLIVLFGVLHHIPSHDLRKKLLENLANSLKPNGLLIFTVWRFGELNRFADRLVNPKDYSIDPTKLEPGDYLVDWRTQSERRTATKNFPVRYAHAVSTQELEKLSVKLPPVVASFLADGKDKQTNRYYLLQKV